MDMSGHPQELPSRSQQEQTCLQPSKVTSAQYCLTQYVYSKGTGLPDKGFRQLGARGYGDSSLTYEGLLAATCLLQVLQTSSCFTSRCWQPSPGSAQWNSRWIFVRGFQLYNINRLFVQLCGAITSNHEQPIFLFPTSEQTWLACHRE